MKPSFPYCDDCKFWLGKRDSKFVETGVCRRFPPTWFGFRPGHEEGKFKALSDFPQTKSLEWCGEYQPTNPKPAGGE